MQHAAELVLLSAVAGEWEVDSSCESRSSASKGRETHAGSQGSIHFNFRLTMTAN